MLLKPPTMASSAFSAVTKQTKRGPHGRRADMASACEASARLDSGLKMSQAPGTSPGITSLRKWQLVASRHSRQTHDKTHDKLHICMPCSSLLSHYSRKLSRSRTQSRHLPLKPFDLSLDWYLSNLVDYENTQTHDFTTCQAFLLNGHVENLTPAAESAWACPCKKTLYWITECFGTNYKVKERQSSTQTCHNSSIELLQYLFLVEFGGMRKLRLSTPQPMISHQTDYWSCPGATTTNKNNMPQRQREETTTYDNYNT